MEIKKLELLSPAKDYRCGEAAINSGADAVYIGAPKFGARAAAGNSLVDIEKLVKYSHRYYAKTYAVVNTLIYENELAEVKRLITDLYNIGIDAVIIQDMGILEMDIPPVPLFASTQTHNYDIEKIKRLEAAGFSRVILARELSLDKIKQIRNSVNIELEFFVHGALCVSFSGQCYFSYATTGRSANRGECSQPCRMLYTLEDNMGKIIEDKKYLLSLKDLNLSDRLEELAGAGISSFKIEGRLKDITYVKNITAFYRQKIDRFIEGNNSYKKSSSGRVFLSFDPDPERTFNRGYTEHFIDGSGTDVGSALTQKATGKKIGKVIKTGEDYFEINTGETVVSGDGLCFFNEDKLLTGMSVIKTEGNKIYAGKTSGLLNGTIIFRNKDRRFIKELLNDSAKRKIGVEIRLYEENDSVMLSAEDEDGNKIKLAAGSGFPPAENRGKMLENLEKQLRKSGDTYFIVNKISIELKSVFFLSISAINSLRRAALEKLDIERNNNRQRAATVKKENAVKNTSITKLTYLANVTNSLAEKHYEERGGEITEPGFELLEDKDGKVVMRTKYCVKSQLNLCPFEKDGNKIKGFSEPLYLNDGKRRFELEFNCSECEMFVKY
jgi:putative protease